MTAFAAMATKRRCANGSAWRLVKTRTPSTRGRVEGMSAGVNLARVDVRRTALIALSLGIAGPGGCATRSGPARTTWRRPKRNCVTQTGPLKSWLDQIYLNRERPWVDRLWHDFRSGAVTH